MRLDALLVQRGLIPSREKAKEAIAAGEVLLDGKPAKKPSQTVDEDALIEVTSAPMPFVSRGGLKLLKALEVFEGFSVQGDHVLDIGASTGGFTDCLLQHGAERVYAIDVGTDQLADKLRQDPRVVSMEGVNARMLTVEDIGEIADGAVMDVAFISITKIIPALEKLVKEDGYLMALVKPQFEAGKAAIGKHGVVKDPQAHRSVLRNTAAFIRDETNFAPVALDISPIKGPEGNVEFIMLCRKNCSGMEHADLWMRIDELVRQAHA